MGIRSIIMAQRLCVFSETGQKDRLTRMLSLYRSLGINKEGIEEILELRKKIRTLQKELEEFTDKYAHR